MTRLTTSILGAALVFAGAASASAQETRPIGLSLRGGLFFGDGDTNFAGGAEFKLKDVNWEGTGSGYTGSITLSLDTLGNDRMPLLMNFVARNAEWYWTGGAGVVFGGDNAKLGFQLGAGYDFVRGSTPLFVEGKYWFGGDSNGLGVYIGVRL
jgi:hypothetical protein